MRLPLLGACAHLEREIDFTHRLIDSAWLRRSFEAVREQVGLKGKRAHGEGLQRRDVGDLQLHVEEIKRRFSRSNRVQC